MDWPIDICLVLLFKKTVLGLMDLTVYIRRHFTKLSRPSDQTDGICASLVYIISLNPSRYVIFVYKEFYVMFTDCTAVFCMVIRTGIISLQNISSLVSITQTECAYCAVRTETLTAFHFSFHVL